VLSYTDKSGRKHRACHTSKKKAKGQIAAIEMRRESEESNEESLIESIIRELINEEIVTIYRGQKGSQSAVYDVDFDDKDAIVRGEPADLKDLEGLAISVKKRGNKESSVKVIDYIRPFTSVPSGAIVTQIRSVLANSGSVLADAADPKSVVDELNKNWLDALDWNPGGSRVGRGEAAAKLAFKQDQGVKEPDFVSNGVKLSIKYFGPDGKGTVKSGEKSKDTVRLCKELREVLKSVGADVTFPQGSWKAEDLQAALLQVPAGPERTKVIEETRRILNDLKHDLCTAHGAEGIIAIDNAYELIAPAEAQDKLCVIYIRNSGTRAEFGGPKKRDSPVTFENVLNSVERGQSAAERTDSIAAGKLRSRLSKKVKLPPEEIADLEGDEEFQAMIKRGTLKKEHRMQISERQLRRMIRETLQREGWMDSVKGALGLGGDKKLKPSDYQDTFNALRERGMALGKEINKLIDRGQRPSDADEGLALSKGIIEAAGIRAVRTVFDHALQALGERGSGERTYENPWMVNEQGTGLEWRDLSSSADPFEKAVKFYQKAIQNRELVTSGNSLVDAKTEAYLKALGENDVYVNARLMDAIIAVQGGRKYSHKEPMSDSVRGPVITALRATYREW